MKSIINPTCAKKRSYKTIACADSECERLNKKQSSDPQKYKTLYVYRCPYCADWHLTSQQPQNSYAASEQAFKRFEDKINQVVKELHSLE